MSKKNKIVYSDVQPNAKEAGVWVNTTDGNVKVEKDGKWVDDGGSSSGSGSELKWEYYKINHSEDKWGFLMNALNLSTYLYYTSSGSTWIEYIGRAYPYINDDYQNVYKIACSSIPTGYTNSNGDSFGVDEGSWKSNFIKWDDGEYSEELFDAVLTPITKEEFYSFYE